jgi:bifunctional non-homologous end joining protein LigD
MPAPLDDYRQKRDFSQTPEPPPRHERGPGAGALTFVVQKHNAGRLHYDFRLEAGGVLKSWAVPKGPSLNPADKRLAVAVEDHPLDYASFEGVIPAGGYGAGQVIVWDRGIYVPLAGEDDTELDRQEAQRHVQRGLAQGRLTFVLHGQKLRGGWSLVRLRRRGDDERDNWLLVKQTDRFAGATHDVTQEDRSVLSGRTIEDLQQEAAC